jgi:hypothetical protein
MSNKLQKSKDYELKGSSKKKLDLAGVNMGTLTNSLNEMTLPRLFYQLVVFVLDASESMTWEGISGKSKGEEVHDQILPILERLKESKNKNSFDLAFWAFSENCSQFIPTSNLTSIDHIKQNFNPCLKTGNYKTKIVPALEEVHKEVSNYLQTHKEKNSQALIIILGDGAIDDMKDAKKITDSLKKNNKITISSYLLEDKNWKNDLSPDLLKSFRDNLKILSSSSADDSLNFFKSTVDPEEIRKHMIKSISTVSKVD